MSAASATVRVMGPAVSWLAAMGTMPSMLNRPWVGFSPTMPFTWAGQMIDPLVSVPRARGASPAATAAPEPELEPQGERSSTWGLRTCPPTEDQPLTESLERKLAHWLRLVFPKMTAPWARRAATTGASSRA
jgi:hypothetical protein